VSGRPFEHLDARERRELCDLFEELGPDAPTLCEGWTTEDLAAHLVVRERHPTAAGGILIPALEQRTEQFMDREKESGYARLVDRVRNGPPFGPFAVPGLRTLINLQEYVVHHEDVRRANGMGPRTDRRDLQDALWGNLRHGARFLLRKVKGATVRLQRPGGETVTTGRGPEVVLTGEPVDLILYLFGRDAAAQVEITGDEGAKRILAEAQRGI
jgi:uncharacterized protein (TIGR03085 family)